jgi:hypothetical protein
MVLAPSATGGAPSALTPPPLSASRSAPLPERESLLPREFEGLSKEQAQHLALIMYLMAENKGQPASPTEPFQITKDTVIGFENLPAYPVNFEEASTFLDLVRDGTAEEVYNFSRKMNKKQFALYYAGLSTDDKITYWDKYSDYEALMLAKGDVISADITPRALEKYMNGLTNDDFRRLMENKQRLSNNVVLAKGNAISRNRMSRKNRAQAFKQKHQGLIIQSARTRRAAGEVPPPYVPPPPPPPRRLGVTERAPLLLSEYSNEEKADFRRHVMEDDAAGLAAYLAQYPQQTLIDLYGELNDASKKVFQSKRAAARDAAAPPPPVTNEEITEAALAEYAARLGEEGPIGANALGARKNITAKYINSLNDAAYKAFKDRLLTANTHSKIQNALPKMQRKDRRRNLTNKLRKDAFLERRFEVLEMRQTVGGEATAAQAELESARAKEAAAREEQQAYEAELATLRKKEGPQNETTRARIQFLIDETRRTAQNIVAIGQRIAFLNRLIELGTAVWNAGAAYLEGGIIGGTYAAYYSAVASYRAYLAYRQAQRMTDLQTGPSIRETVEQRKSAIQKLENSIKEGKRVMTINNIAKRKILVDVSLDLSEALGSFGMVKVDDAYKPVSSRHATASLGKHEVKIENGTLFVYINDSEKNTIKREIPIPAKAAEVATPLKKVDNMKVTISHNISLTSEGTGAAAAAGGGGGGSSAFSAAAGLAGAAGLGGAAAGAASLLRRSGGQPTPQVPWITISYEADVYVDSSGKYFFYFLNQPKMEIPLLLLDKTWK